MTQRSQNILTDQTVTLTESNRSPGGDNEGSSEGRGGQPDLVFPFSPGDVGGVVSVNGSKSSLQRYLARSGVDRSVAAKVSQLNVHLFINVDEAGLQDFTGDERGDRAILRAAQSGLRAELALRKKEEGRKRGRELFQEENDDEEESGLECLSRLAGQPGKSAATRKQVRSEIVALYSDPYMLGAVTEEGKNHITFVYGEQHSDGTERASRMPSLKYPDSEKKKLAEIKISRLNLCLLSFDKTDIPKRAEAISTILLIIDPSRWQSLLASDWSPDIPAFKSAAYNHWSLPVNQRNWFDWVGIDMLKQIPRSTPIMSIEGLQALVEFNWAVSGRLCITRFENVKGESGSSKTSPCNRFNSGLVTVIRRLNHIMIALMSLSYKGVFEAFIRFVTESDEASRIGGDQIAYNFDYAMVKVSSSVKLATPMKLGDGSTHGIKGPREVAFAIMAAMEFQVELMHDRGTMRDQKEDLSTLMTRQIERSLEGSSEKPSTRIIYQDASKEQQSSIRLSDNKKGSRGGNKSDRKGVEKAKSDFLCVAYLGDSLGAAVGTKRSHCPKNADKCFFQHKEASSITRAEAEESLKRPADSEMKRVILQKIAEFTRFKP